MSKKCEQIAGILNCRHGKMYKIVLDWSDAAKQFIGRNTMKLGPAYTPLLKRSDPVTPVLTSAGSFIVNIPEFQQPLTNFLPLPIEPMEPEVESRIRRSPNSVANPGGGAGAAVQPAPDPQ